MASPYCVDGTCYDGSAGDNCEFDSDCAAEAPFCENVGDTCSTGEPGEACALNNDCLSDDCDVPNMSCN